MSGRDFQAASFLAIVNALYITNMTDEIYFHYVIPVVRSLIFHRTANHTSFPTSSKLHLQKIQPNGLYEVRLIGKILYMLSFPFLRITFK